MTAEPAPGEHGKSLWQRLTPVFVVAALALAAFLLYRTLGRYDFDELVASVTSVPSISLAVALGWAAASYFCLTFFDYLAVRYAGHPLPYRRCALASFTALSIGHNLGFAFLSSGAIRYRFYSRAGLGGEEVAKVIIFCGATVVLGLMTLAGVALLLRPDLFQEMTGLDPALVFAIAAGCLAVPVVYLSLALFLRRTFTVWGRTIEVPSIRLALGQMVVGPLNFACVAACLYQVISAKAALDYFTVASVYVAANIATLISHVPGGLGVIESVVLFLLPEADLIGAVLVYRFIYFLLPLCLGGSLFLIAEMRSGVLRTPFGAGGRKVRSAQ